ncbi:RluA family pseudouridine synthase [Aerococcus kribbianus]|uniref:RNA pseudouridylate synthase n=1 Tax=Aerococcus kribbianus TaxID=2999064 RepID=A0A9X3FMK9_9LACT|nr:MULTISPECIES: RluA family pseudouridine synthase [unclassified Aerococcus]MCZ0717255.1 RluA family pseudouridine synthase [Aerococcus sp. YH-aer221]MCZ0725543.1 RluA family pseudouridine synthase [Aerococcus sp. YH-aer222]
MDQDVIYEDNHLLVVNKPVNMPVQADKSQDPDLLTAAKHYIKKKYNKPGAVYLGLVHRLDRPTGGALVFARTSKAASRLSKQLQKNEFDRQYLAILHGHLEHSQGQLHNYLLKDKAKNIVSVVDSKTPQAKEALLDYKLLASDEDYSLVQVRLHTGRSHQIRVQFSNIGHPLYGDQKYGADYNRKGQQLALWAWQLSFKHPTLKDWMTFHSEPFKTEPWTRFAESFNW